MPWVRYAFDNVCNYCKMKGYLMEAFKGFVMQIWKRINAVVSIGKDLLFQIFFAKTLRQAPHELVLLCLSIVDLSLLHYFVLQLASGTHGAGESQTH